MPLIPMAMTLLIFILLISFNRTINRLTKPVTFLMVISILSSAIISSFYYLKKIEGTVSLSNYLKVLEETNLSIHLNLLNEKIIVFFTIIISILIGLSFYKLPRRKGYISFIISIGFLSSLIILSILLLDLSNLRLNLT